MHLQFTCQTTKIYYTKTSWNTSNDFELSYVSEAVIKKILLGLDTSKEAGIDQISAKFVNNGAEVSALLLKNIINSSTKLSTFLGEFKFLR